MVVGDFNEDVQSQAIKEWKNEAGLEDVLMERNMGDKALPPTFIRGVCPIDTIMCTVGVSVRKAGYLSFGEGVGDHRPIFADITVASTLGVKLSDSKKMAARRLKLVDPRVVKRYNKLLNGIFPSKFSLRPSSIITK